MDHESNDLLSHEAGATRILGRRNPRKEPRLIIIETLLPFLWQCPNILHNSIKLLSRFDHGRKFINSKVLRVCCTTRAMPKTI